jgi:cyclase
LLKRLIGVITVSDNWAVQSIGYNKYLPLGKPEVIAENFDRWQLDEILIVDITRSKYNKGPNLKMLEKIASKKIMTPLCYTGGIRCKNDAIDLISCGADRLGIDSLFRYDKNKAYSISDAVGRQAVIRIQPVFLKKSDLFIYDHLSKKIVEKLNIDELKKTSEFYSELMLVDTINEGYTESFNKKILKPLKNSNIQVICFGGITSKKQIKNLFDCKEVSAVAVGNSLSYQEIPNKKLLDQTEVDIVRQTDFGLVTQGAREW